MADGPAMQWSTGARLADDDHLMVLMRVDERTLYAYYEVGESAVAAAALMLGRARIPSAMSPQMVLRFEWLVRRGPGAQRHSRVVSVDGRIGTRYFDVATDAFSARVVFAVRNRRGAWHAAAASAWLPVASAERSVRLAA
jgi:hypothetical protein